MIESFVSSLPSSLNGLIAYSFTESGGSSAPSSGVSSVASSSSTVIPAKAGIQSLSGFMSGGGFMTGGGTISTGQSPLINYTSRFETSKSWSVSQSGLTSGAAAVLGIATGALTAGIGGFGASLGGGLSASSVGTVAMETAITSLASTGAVSLVNNKFNLGKTAKDLGSSESLKSLGQSMGIATLTFGISQGTGQGTGIGKVTTSSPASVASTSSTVSLNSLLPVERFASMAQKGLVQASVSSLVTGEKLGKSLASAGGIDPQLWKVGKDFKSIG